MSGVRGSDAASIMDVNVTASRVDVKKPSTRISVILFSMSFFCGC